nr:MAG TPA: hypothetical protein [Caudoviricetes sp.]
MSLLNASIMSEAYPSDHCKAYWRAIDKQFPERCFGQ